MTSSKILGLLLCLGLTGQAMPASAGKIVLMNDHWPLWCFDRCSPDSARFARNIANWFCEREQCHFLAFSSAAWVMGPAFGQEIDAAGFGYTKSTSVAFTVETLLQFDGVFLGGDQANNAVLIDYVNAGGNVLLQGGTGVGTGTQESARWNTFLGAFGLRYSPGTGPNEGNGIHAEVPIPPSAQDHPIFAGVFGLTQNNGLWTNVIDPGNPLTRELVPDLYAVYESPGPCGDGVVSEGEECDDGNTDDGDCCSSSCQFEAPFTVCGDETDLCETTPGICDGAGLCVGAGRLDCDDGNLCTSDSCDPGSGCVNTSLCVDGDVCTVDRCDAAVGACNHEVIPSCAALAEEVAISSGESVDITLLGGATVPGGVELTFPPGEGGSVSAQLITAEIADIGLLTESLDGFDAVDFGTVTQPVMFWDFGFSAGPFSAPVTVVIGYDDSMIVPPLEEGDLAIYHFTDGSWQPVDRMIDTEANTITFLAESFSFFALGGSAEDFPMEGARLLLRDLGTARHRIVRFRAVGEVAPVGGTADPTVLGATLRLIGVGEPDVDVGPLSLGSANWRGLGRPAGVKGYRFADRLADHGIRLVSVRPRGAGLTLSLSGGGHELPISKKGGQAGPIRMELTIGNETYCVTFEESSFRKNRKGLVIAGRSVAPMSCLGNQK